MSRRHDKRPNPINRGAPIVDGPCRCDCGREFVNLDARRQHTLRVHAEPVKGPLIRYGVSPAAASIGIVAAMTAALAGGRRRR